MYRLNGIVQHYSWGGMELIPGLIGVSNDQSQPFAEYWLGAHPNHPSLLHEEKIALLHFIEKNPQALGNYTLGKFAGLPYLLKVLDVRQMLSIQVHPAKEAARENFLKEHNEGVAISAAHRNYKDENHKPELMVALGDFWLLHGFKPEVNMGVVFNATPELAPLREIYESHGLKALYEHVMYMDQQKVNGLLSPLMKRILPLYENGSLEKKEEDFWAARAALNFCKDNNYDRGIFSIYLFNLVYLAKGEGIFQPEGMPHAYLEGQNVEVMANSDNVLRAGLTDKHIDVPELLKHVTFQSTVPKILSPAGRSHKVFESPAEEFELHQYNLQEEDQESLTTTSGEIFLLINGEAGFECGSESQRLKKGEALFITSGNEVSISAVTDINLFRVTVPEV
jgi:mannose-6-phosphate isomerase